MYDSLGLHGLCRAAVKTQIERTDLWTLVGKERVAWKHIHYHMQTRESMGICCVTKGAHPVFRENPEGWGGERDGRELLDI